jgi:hypothetical protein
MTPRPALRPSLSPTKLVSRTSNSDFPVTVGAIEQRLELRIDAVEQRLGRVEERLTGIEERLTKVERDVFLIKWMVGFVLALQLGTFFMLWQLTLKFQS